MVAIITQISQLKPSHALKIILTWGGEACLFLPNVEDATVLETLDTDPVDDGCSGLDDLTFGPDMLALIDIAHCN